ncbi:MAG: hypothetical protein K6F33_01660 [Bacteroidales bacterium]|nr:hypothetical protein [Bacteroidales bacterium]
MKRLVAIAIFLMPFTVCAQQRITIDGYQERMPNANAELRCNGIRISRTMQIDSISGYHNGFWIVKGNRIEKAYWTLRHADSSIGYQLKPGFYYVYPNIILPSDTAHITLWLK